MSKPDGNFATKELIPDTVTIPRSEYDALKAAANRPAAAPRLCAICGKPVGAMSVTMVTGRGMQPTHRYCYEEYENGRWAKP